MHQTWRKRGRSVNTSWWEGEGWVDAREAERPGVIEHVLTGGRVDVRVDEVVTADLRPMRLAEVWFDMSGAWIWVTVAVTRWTVFGWVQRFWFATSRHQEENDREGEEGQRFTSVKG